MMDCNPANGPEDAVAIAMGLCSHSSSKRSSTFFKLAGYPPLYSGVTIIIPSDALIFSANAVVSFKGFF